MTTELVKSISIENMVAQRNALTERFASLCAMLKEINDLMGAMGLGEFDSLATDGSRHYSVNIFSKGDHMPALTKRLDALAWNRLMDESGIRSFMDSKAREEWFDAIQKKDVIPFELDNIHATFGHLRDSRGSMMERGVCETFRILSWDYKTNLPVKFGKRVILDNLIDVSNYNNGGRMERYIRTNWRVANYLNDLDRVFRLLDGKPELDHRNSVEQTVSAAVNRKELYCDTDYFDIKLYLKGTGHITFKRLDLVKQCNLIVAKHHPNALPEAT